VAGHRRSESAAAAHRLDPRHLHDLERLHQLVEIDARRVLQFAYHALGESPQPFRQPPQLEPAAGPRRRHHVVRAGRKRRPLPAAVTHPVGDVRLRHAGFQSDLAIAQRGPDNQAAHRLDGRIGVRPSFPATYDRGRPLGGFVRLDAEAGEDGRNVGQDHDTEYSPISASRQVEGTTTYAAILRGSPKMATISASSPRRRGPIRRVAYGVGGDRKF